MLLNFLLFYMLIFPSVSQRMGLVKKRIPTIVCFFIEALVTKYSHFRFRTFLGKLKLL